LISFVSESRVIIALLGQLADHKRSCQHAEIRNHEPEPRRFVVEIRLPYPRIRSRVVEPAGPSARFDPALAISSRQDCGLCAVVASIKPALRLIDRARMRATLTSVSGAPASLIMTSRSQLRWPARALSSS